MKKLFYIFCSASFLIFSSSCEQELVDNTASPCPSDDPSIICPGSEQPACPPDASAGSADFSKFVAIGTSYTAGFQAGALFNEGQANSLGKILATQFACVGGGAFNQPDINSEHGYNVFFSTNPVGTTVLGRFKLQGTPPQPSPVISGMEAVPNPQVNPGFMYTGSDNAVPANELNNFSVPLFFMGQALIPQSGDWGLAGLDPRFSPFYARFASIPGTSTLIADAAASVANDGTFVLFWLGMDDAILHAAYGGDGTRAPLTSLPAFEGQYDLAIGSILQANPEAKGVVASYPDPFVMPHFRAVAWNRIAFTAADEATIAGVNGAYAAYNGGLDAALGASLITEEEVAKRKISFAIGANGIVIEDETLTDLTGMGLPSIRQAAASDLIPLSAGLILGTEDTPGDPSTTWGVGKALTDQYALIPEEIDEIREHIAGFNAHVKSVAEASADRLAFADVNLAMKNLVMAQAGIANGITYTPNIDPPTGIYSEDGLHPNNRGYAVIANIFIDAINAKFGATVPKANLAGYSATGLPINP